MKPAKQFNVRQTKGGYSIIKYTGKDTDVVIPSEIDGKSVVAISESAFKDCHLLRSLSIPQGIEKLEDEVFYGCTNLKSISLPDTLKSVGKKCFYGCNSLGNLSFPASCSDFDDDSFAGYDFVGNISIDEEAVANNPELLKYVAHISVYDGEHIESRKYSNYCGVTHVAISESIKTIGDCAFACCPNLQKCDIDGSNVETGIASFAGCKSLCDVPSGISIIGSFGFAGSRSIKKVTVGTDISIVNSFAFFECSSLCEVDLNGKIDKIGDLAFASCSNLKNVYCHDVEIGEIADNAFTNCNDGLCFHLDKECDFSEYLKKKDYRYTVNGASVNDNEENPVHESVAEDDFKYSYSSVGEFVIKDVTLPSIFEMEKRPFLFARIFEDCDIETGNMWKETWLATGNTFYDEYPWTMVQLGCSYQETRTRKPDDSELSIRPVLKIEMLKSYGYYIGSKIELSGLTWMFISDDMLLCYSTVDKTVLSDADKNTVFEKSRLKPWLVNWAKDNDIKIRPARLFEKDNQLSFVGISLLSIGEARSLLSNKQINIGCSWWLKSLGKFNKGVTYVAYDGNIDDCGMYSDYSIGIRPALKIANNTFSQVMIGDRIQIAGYSWTKISKDLLLCDVAVANGPFCSIIDGKEAISYSDSDINKWLYDWAAENSIGFEQTGIIDNSSCHLEFADIMLPSYSEVLFLHRFAHDCLWSNKESFLVRNKDEEGNSLYVSPYVSGDFNFPSKKHLNYASDPVCSRPLLLVANSDQLNMLIGEKVWLGGVSWTLVTRDLLFCDSVIGKSYKRTNASQYQYSDVKHDLIDWLLSCGITLSEKKSGFRVTGIDFLTEYKARLCLPNSFGTEEIKWLIKDDRSKPYFHNNKHHSTWDCCNDKDKQYGVKPLLTIVPDDGVVYHVDDSVYYAGLRWTFISENELLCDEIIGWSEPENIDEFLKNWTHNIGLSKEEVKINNLL